MPGAHVEVLDVYKNYLLGEKEVLVLQNINFSILPGEIVVVMGASGVGKSTLLHILGSLDVPTSGKIFIDGEDVNQFSEQQKAEFRNNSLGFVFQFHYLLPEFSSLENVAMPALIAGYKEEEAIKRAKELLQSVGLSHREEHRPYELSGGEQQRVALARALVMKPKLLLADEPTGNLDEETAEHIHSLMIELNRKHGTTMLIVTHNKSWAEKINKKWSLKAGHFFRE